MTDGQINRQMQKMILLSHYFYGKVRKQVWFDFAQWFRRKSDMTNGRSNISGLDFHRGLRAIQKRLRSYFGIF